MKRIYLVLLLAVMNCVALSAREYLIQTEWDQSTNSSLLPTFSDGTHVVAGCGTIAAAQVINYYGWLPEHDATFKIDVTYDLSNFPEGSSELKLEREDVWCWRGKFHCSGFPSTADSLIQAIFYSEADLINSDGTSTSPWSLYGTFTNHFGYDVEAYVTNEYSDANEVVFCKIISTEEQKEIARKAILAQHPVIVNGKDHSFILDGYDSETDQFHFNLGWGPGYNYWGDFRSWADGRYSIYIPTPNKEKIAMPEIAVEDSIPLHIRNLETGEDHIGYINESAYFDFKDQFAYHIPAGSYEIWLEFPDGSILAPQFSVDRKSFADGLDGIVSYSFKRSPALFYIDDRENYGFLINAGFYYDTRMGYFDMRIQEGLSYEGLGNADIKVVYDGKTYNISDHDGIFCTIPIKMKAGSVVEWLAYYNDVPFGLTSSSLYQNALEFDNDYEVIMIQPAKMSSGYIGACYVDDEGVNGGTELCGNAKYNSTNPFKFKLPTELYCFNGSEQEFYSGPVSTLQKLQPEYIYVAFSYSVYGAAIFIYNKMPPSYEFATGVVFDVDGEVTAVPLTPGSTITAPTINTKEGYTLSAWEPALNEGDTVPDGIVEYYASWIKNQYHLTAVVDGDTIDRGTLNYQDEIDYFDVPSKGDSVWVWDKQLTNMPSHDYVITGSYQIPTYKVDYYVDGEIVETYTVTVGDTIPSCKYICQEEGYEYKWTSGDDSVYITMPNHDIDYYGSMSLIYYHLTAVVDGDSIDRGWLNYQDMIDYFDVPNKGDSVWVWDKQLTTMPAHDYVITGSYQLPSYTVYYYTAGGIVETYTVQVGDTIPSCQYVDPYLPEGYEYIWLSTDGNEYTTMPAHDVYFYGTPETSIDTVASTGISSDVYSITGLKVASGSSAPKALPKGIYITNGKRCMVR